MTIKYIFPTGGGALRILDGGINNAPSGSDVLIGYNAGCVSFSLWLDSPSARELAQAILIAADAADKTRANNQPETAP